MTDRAPVGLWGFEVFGAAVGLALIAGGLSIVAPSLEVLTGTLAAISVAGWASGRRRPGAPPILGGSPGCWAGRFGAGMAATVYLFPSGPLVPFRGLILAVGLVPFWVVERGRCRDGGPPGGVR